MSINFSGMKAYFLKINVAVSRTVWLIISLFLLNSQVAKSQCTNTNSYGSNSAPAIGVTTLYPTTCLNEYNTLTGVVAGATYVSTHPATALNTYVTVHSGSYNGPVVAYGFSPLMWTAAVAGNHYIHYNTNAACGATCSNNLQSRISRVTVTTSCATTFTDAGGGGSYSDNKTDVWVFYPSTPGDKVVVTFTSFATENNYDGLMIYNGNSNLSPLITSGLGVGSNSATCPAGSWRGTGSPGTITSTAPDGSLTFVFMSDGATTAAGWSANVTCFSPCATVAGTSSASVTSGCGSTSTTLSLAGEGPGTIQWQQSTDGGATWNNIVGAITDPYVHTTSVTRLYRAAVTNGCTSYSTTSSFTASCPDIIHPASGFSTSTIQCGGSYIYRDPGNTGNYGNNQNGLITICPSIAGRYVNVNFTSFNTESGYDYIIVFDGDWAGAPILGIYSGTSLSGNVRATASNSSGCLSFRFYSDGATVAAGWQATVTCNSTPSATVPSSNPEDCQGAYVVCSGGTFTGGTNNYGFDELPDRWNSCLGNAGQRGEYESTWAVFSPATSGTIGFAITPTTACDYDWAIWGPYTSVACPAYTNDVPIRCSSTSLANTGGGGTTGLIAPAMDVIEQNGEYGGGANENGKLRPLDVLAGQIYVMMLDNWSANTTPFSLNWTLTNGATLDCTPPLPITLSNLSNSCFKGKTLIEWSTATETNNDYFAIEKSDGTFNFVEIGRVRGAGNSNINQHYSFTDPTLNDKTTYYRIKQVDYNGQHTYYRVFASNCYNNEFEVVHTQLNSNNLDLIINSFEQENIVVYLYDIHGKLIIQENKTLGIGNNKLNVSQFNISSGVYLISIVGEVHHYQSKLLKR